MPTSEEVLRELLSSLSPELLADTFVFCCVGDAGLEEVVPLAPFACVREAEGLTLVVESSRARWMDLEGSAPMRCITLGVHSSLDAVGLTAAVSVALTRAGIAANVIAGFHHDHVFVPEPRAAEALDLLRELSRAA